MTTQRDRVPVMVFSNGLRAGAVIRHHASKHVTVDGISNLPHVDWETAVVDAALLAAGETRTSLFGITVRAHGDGDTAHVTLWTD